MSTLAHESPLSRSAGRKPASFYVGAVADVVVGLDLTIFGPEIARLILPDHVTIRGFESASMMRFLGLFLILFAIETVVVARSQGTLGRFRSWIVAANWATVVLAVVVLAAAHSAFSVLGIAAVVAIVVAVGVIAFLQGKSL
jgi:hypothetical protein